MSDVFDVLSQSILLNGLKKKNKNLMNVDILIQPELQNYTILDFNKNSLDSIYALGYKATYKKLSELKNLSPHHTESLKLSAINGDQIIINSVKIDSKSNISVEDLFLNNFPITFSKEEIIDYFKRLRLSNKYNNIHFSFAPIDEQYTLIINLEKNMPITINNIIIEGNNKIDDNFIIKILEISKGDFLDYNKLDDKISELYNMDFFESIRYEFLNFENNITDLKFIFNESDFKRLKIGGSWSNYYKLIAKLKLDLIYKPFDKFRIQEELRIGNQLKENNLKILYTGNYNFQFRIIPFMEFNNMDNKINYYTPSLNFEERNITVDQQAFGLIIPINNLGFIEMTSSSLALDYNTTNSENVESHYYNLKIELDKIDNILYPQSGYRMRYYHEYSSSDNYNLHGLSFDNYTRILNKSSIRVYGDYLYSNDILPMYKNINYFAPDRILSFGEYKLYGSNLMSSGIEFNYIYKNSQIFRLIFNSIDYVDFPEDILEIKNLNSLGIGLRIKSIFGPVNFLWTKSNKDLFDSNAIENYYFSIGIDY